MVYHRYRRFVGAILVIDHRTDIVTTELINLKGKLMHHGLFVALFIALLLS